MKEISLAGMLTDGPSWTIVLAGVVAFSVLLIDFLLSCEAKLLVGW